MEESKEAILPLRRKKECKNSPFRLPGPKKSTWQDLKTRLFASLDARSRVDEMPDLAFSSSWTQEVASTRCRISPSRFLWPRSWVDEMPDLVFSPSWTQEVELTRCRISPSRLLGPNKSSWRDAGSRLLAFLDPGSRVDKMPDLVFSPSWTQEVELTRCRISSSRLLHVLGPRKPSWQDARSRLPAFLDPRSRVDEMPDLVFLSSLTQKVELTRCRISPSRLLGPTTSYWRDARSRLLPFLDPRSRVDEMPDLAFSFSCTREAELRRHKMLPSELLGPNKVEKTRN